MTWGTQAAHVVRLNKHMTANLSVVQKSREQTCGLQACSVAPRALEVHGMVFLLRGAGTALSELRRSIDRRQEER